MNDFVGNILQNKFYSYCYILPGPQPEGEQSGNCFPPKFSQTYVFVRYSNKLHHFAPRKYQLVVFLHLAIRYTPMHTYLWRCYAT